MMIEVILLLSIILVMMVLKEQAWRPGIFT